MHLHAHLEAWWPVWVVVIASRIGVIVVGLLSQYAATSRGIAEYVPFVESATFIHYADVVSRGYTAANAYEFPLYPALIGMVSATGVSLGVAAMLISNACFVAGAMMAAVLGERYVGREAAVAGTTLLALWPTAHFFSLASTESLMLACMCGAVFAALRATTGGWLLAAPLAGACAVTRPPGAFVGLILLGIAVSQLVDGRMRRPGMIGAAITAGAAIPAALVGFFWYLRTVTGDFQAAFHAQEQFGRELSISGPWTAITSAVGNIRSGSLGVAFELVAVALVVVMLAVFARQSTMSTSERYGWVAFGVASLLLPLATGLVWQIPRFAMLILPVFWAMGVLAQRWKWGYASLLVLLPMALAFRTVLEVVGVQQ